MIQIAICTVRYTTVVSHSILTYAHGIITAPAAAAAAVAFIFVAAAATVTVVVVVVFHPNSVIDRSKIITLTFQMR